MNVDSADNHKVSKNTEVCRLDVKGDIQMLVADEFKVDAKYDTVAISGAFPVPLKFFESINYHVWGLEELHLKDFLDEVHLISLYKEMFEACKREQVKLLIIQSPPAAYIVLKKVIEEYIFQFVDNYQVAASECLAQLWDKILAADNYKLSVLFLLPSQGLVGRNYHDDEVNPDTIFKGLPDLDFAAPYDKKVFILGKANANYIDPLVEKFAQVYPSVRWKKLVFTDSEKLFKYVE